MVFSVRWGKGMEEVVEKNQNVAYIKIEVPSPFGRG
jgi:hypothetical protein